eukprot:749129-Hanusia_phi.AAC.3
MLKELSDDEEANADCEKENGGRGILQIVSLEKMERRKLVEWKFYTKEKFRLLSECFSILRSTATKSRSARRIADLLLVTISLLSAVSHETLQESWRRHVIRRCFITLNEMCCQSKKVQGAQEKSIFGIIFFTFNMWRREISMSIRTDMKRMIQTTQKSALLLHHFKSWANLSTASPLHPNIARRIQAMFARRWFTRHASAVFSMLRKDIMIVRSLKCKLRQQQYKNLKRLLKEWTRSSADNRRKKRSCWIRRRRITVIRRKCPQAV